MAGYANQDPRVGSFETAQTTAYGNVGANYSELGTTSHPSRILIINNFTDTNIWISTNGTDNMFALPKGGHFIQDTASNGISFSANTTFYVKRLEAAEAPTSGQVVLSLAYQGV